MIWRPLNRDRVRASLAPSSIARSIQARFCLRDSFVDGLSTRRWLVEISAHGAPVQIADGEVGWAEFAQAETIRPTMVSTTAHFATWMPRLASELIPKSWAR